MMAMNLDDPKTTRAIADAFAAKIAGLRDQRLKHAQEKADHEVAIAKCLVEMKRLDDEIRRWQIGRFAADGTLAVESGEKG